MKRDELDTLSGTFYDKAGEVIQDGNENFYKE